MNFVTDENLGQARPQDFPVQTLLGFAECCKLPEFLHRF